VVSLNDIFSRIYADWVIAPDGLSATQASNSRETFLCSDGNVVGSALQGVISVQSTEDDDFIGFAFGYAPGDNENPNADYLLFGKHGIM
jgi:hypothetical protein